MGADRRRRIDTTGGIQTQAARATQEGGAEEIGGKYWVYISSEISRGEAIRMQRMFIASML